MGKFETTLKSSGKSIKATRAKIIAEDAEYAQEEIVRELKKKKRELISKLSSLTDIYPDSELSLKVVKADFNAEKHFKDIHSVKVELANLDVEINIAKETSKEWFDA